MPSLIFWDATPNILGCNSTPARGVVLGCHFELSFRDYNFGSPVRGAMSGCNSGCHCGLLCCRAKETYENINVLADKCGNGTLKILLAMFTHISTSRVSMSSPILRTESLSFYKKKVFEKSGFWDAIIP